MQTLASLPCRAKGLSAAVRGVRIRFDLYYHSDSATLCSLMRLLHPSFTGPLPFLFGFTVSSRVRVPLRSKYLDPKVGKSRAASAIAAVKEYAETASLPTSIGFEALGLGNELLSAIRERSFEAPTEIQVMF